MAAAQDNRLVNEHYGRQGLGEVMLEGLRAAGKDIDRLSHLDLAPVDQFHAGGIKTTRALAELAAIGTSDNVLDVGGGVGGPARTLAAEFGCSVTVLDVTEEFCRVGEMLTSQAGLNDRVKFEIGSALAMPFPDASFDVVWTQHSSMNIADKARLYAEIYRVLRPGGRLALHEITADRVQPIHFPAHWARTPDLSFLLPTETMREIISASGFHERLWLDQTAAALIGFRKGLEVATSPTPPPLSLHLLLGDNFLPALTNMVRNVEEGRIAFVKAVFDKP